MTHSAERKGTFWILISSARRFGALLSETVFTTVSVFLLLCLLCSWLCQSVPPSSFIPLVYFGLFFPFIAVACGVWWFVILFLGRRLQMLIFLPSVLCAGMVGRTFPMNSLLDCDYFEEEECGEEGLLKVMTYNVMGFKYNEGSGADSISKYILSQSPDICFLQEYIEQNKGSKWEKATSRLLKKYDHTSHAIVNTYSSYIIMTLSRYEIIEEGIVCKGSKNNTAIYCDVKVGEDTIRCINCHLTSNHLSTTDKKHISGAAKGSQSDRDYAVEAVSRKFSGSYVERQHMAVHIDSFIRASNLPVVLAGDFNDVPVSFAYNKIRGERMRVAGREAGRGYNYTYSDFPFYVCIDHIMYSKEIECAAYKRTKIPYSDHYPSMAMLRLLKDKK